MSTTTTQEKERTDTKSEVTQEKFLEGLNVDLAHEYSAVITYRTYASQVQGQWRMELRQFFELSDFEPGDAIEHHRRLQDDLARNQRAGRPGSK